MESVHKRIQPVEMAHTKKMPKSVSKPQTVYTSQIRLPQATNSPTLHEIYNGVSHHQRPQSVMLTSKERSKTQEFLISTKNSKLNPWTVEAYKKALEIEPKRSLMELPRYKNVPLLDLHEVKRNRISILLGSETDRSSEKGRSSEKKLSKRIEEQRRALTSRNAREKSETALWDMKRLAESRGIVDRVDGKPSKEVASEQKKLEVKEKFLKDILNEESSEEFYPLTTAPATKSKQSKEHKKLIKLTKEKLPPPISKKQAEEPEMKNILSAVTPIEAKPQTPERPETGQRVYKPNYWLDDKRLKKAYTWIDQDSDPAQNAQTKLDSLVSQRSQMFQKRTCQTQMAPSFHSFRKQIAQNQVGQSQTIQMVPSQMDPLSQATELPLRPHTVQIFPVTKLKSRDVLNGRTADGERADKLNTQRNVKVLVTDDNEKCEEYDIRAREQMTIDMVDQEDTVLGNGNMKYTDAPCDLQQEWMVQWMEQLKQGKENVMFSLLILEIFEHNLRGTIQKISVIP